MLSPRPLPGLDRREGWSMIQGLDRREGWSMILAPEQAPHPVSWPLAALEAPHHQLLFQALEMLMVGRLRPGPPLGYPQEPNAAEPGG